MSEEPAAPRLEQLSVKRSSSGSAATEPADILTHIVPVLRAHHAHTSTDDDPAPATPR